jgi:hypothetical protein
MSPRVDVEIEGHSLLLSLSGVGARTAAAMNKRLGAKFRIYRGCAG